MYNQDIKKINFFKFYICIIYVLYMYYIPETHSNKTKDIE